MKCGLPGPAAAAAAFSGWPVRSPARRHLGRVLDGAAASNGARRTCSLLPGSRGVAPGRQGSALRGAPSGADAPRPPGQALCPRSRLRDPRPGSPSCPRAPSGAAAGHRAAGWLSLCPSQFRVGETQVGAARREEPSLCHQKRIVRAWAEIETNSHGVIRAPTPFSAASILKNKIKPRRLPDAGAPPARGGAASPWWRRPRSPAGAHFSTFNETFEASRGDRRAPGPMGRSGRAGIPPLRGSRGGSSAWARRASLQPRRGRWGEARPLQSAGLPASARQRPAPSTAAHSRRPAALLGPVVLQTQGAHFLASARAPKLTQTQGTF